MAIKITEHGGHKHTSRIIKEEILGLKFDTTNVDDIIEAVGWKQEQAIAFGKQFNKFHNMQQSIWQLDKNLPEPTKTSELVDFLKSKYFQDLGIKLKTPNDYFALGFIYSAVIFHIEAPRGLPIMGGRISTEDLMDILKKGDE